MQTAQCFSSEIRDNWFEGANKKLKPRIAADSSRVYRMNYKQPFERLIIKFHEGTGIRWRKNSLHILTKKLQKKSSYKYIARDIRKVQKILSAHGLVLRRRFTRREYQLDKRKQLAEQRSGNQQADLNLYYAVNFAKHSSRYPIRSIIYKLNRLRTVEIAFAETPTVSTSSQRFSYGFDIQQKTSQKLVIKPLDTSPLLTGYQNYMDAAPIGLGSSAVWSIYGGRGEGITFMDYDTGYNPNHEDLPAVTGVPASISKNHGTAVLGIIGAKHNGIGLSGMADKVKLRFKSSSSLDAVDAIEQGLAQLNPGDVFLIETAKKDISIDAKCDDGQENGHLNSVVFEHFSDGFDVISMAVAIGVNVVETAGNGCVNYDSDYFGYDFDPKIRDSGAIIVGASSSVRREPLWYSNYGSRVDMHAWGENVASLQYFRDPKNILFNGGLNRVYGGDFGGTSSAGAIIAGGVAQLQGIAKNANASGRSYDPVVLRELMVEQSTAQQFSVTNKLIGPMPDIYAVSQIILNNQYCAGQFRCTFRP